LAISPGAEQTERENFEQIVLVDRLRKSVAVLNPIDAKSKLFKRYCEFIRLSCCTTTKPFISY
jgi:hypothetical protein